MLCVLVFAMLLTCVHAMAAKISNASAENASGAEITAQDDSSFKVTYTAQKDKEYVVMVVSEDGVGEGNVPTKESIGNNQEGVVVYMDQAKGDSEGKVEFTVRPNLENAEGGDQYFVYVSSNEGSGSAMKKVGSFSIDELLALLGDVNGDGTVDVKDRAYLTRYLAHWDGYSVEINVCDLNSDGAVDVKDRAILTRYLAHWDGYVTLPYQS